MGFRMTRKKLEQGVFRLWVAMSGIAGALILYPWARFYIDGGHRERFEIERLVLFAGSVAAPAIILYVLMRLAFWVYDGFASP